MNRKEFLAGMMAGMFGGVLAGLLMNSRLTAAPSPLKTVSAEQFVLTDSKGNVRGVFSVQNDTAVLGIQGPEGERLALGVGRGQTSISYQDKNKKNPFTLSATDAQGPVMVFNSLKDKSGVGLGVAGGTPIVYLQDMNSKVRASMVLAQNTQTPVMSVTNAKGEVKGSLVGQ